MKGLGIKSTELTPKARYLYKRARQFISSSAAYRKRVAALKLRLSSARKFPFAAHDGALRQDAIKFCLTQLQKRRISPRGQRYSINEKLLSLALFKTSGSAYNFLARWFKLPSRRTLRRLLVGIEVDEGISDLIMENMKSQAKSLKPRDRMCMLIWDEMSLSPGLSFDRRKDCIIGINNMEFMDHALVFMARGITKKWKQTVAYHFCKGATKVETLKHLIKSLVRRLGDAGKS